MNGLQFRCRHRFASGFELHAELAANRGVTALFGPSGSGKSTCLGIIAGVLTPQAGRVVLDDSVLLDVAARINLPPEKRNVGIVFQEHRLFPHLTTAGNLRFGERRRNRGAIDFADLVEVLELGELLDRYPHQLSGGQRQRVALGRGILCGPRMLLMDEPLSALDQELKERILIHLERALAKWEITTLFVSHDQADVRRLAHEVIVLEAGKVVAAGPASTTLDRAVALTLQAHPGPVNFLRVHNVKPAGGYWEAQIGQHTIHLPLHSAAGPPPVYVQFLPSDVTLSRTRLTGVSVRNQLPGQVREIASIDDRVFVAVDVGALLWAEVTAEAARELGLAVDASVICLVKTAAMKVAR